jgi:hypothetical protein
VAAALDAGARRRDRLITLNELDPERRSREMFPYKSLVIARQLDELRAEASARRLVAAPRIDDRHDASRRSRPVLDSPFVTPSLEGYPYPSR